MPNIHAVVISTVLLAAFSQALAWNYEVGEEDWGKTCYASEKNQDAAEIVLLTSAHEFRPVMLLSPYKASYGSIFPVRLFVDENLIATLSGSSPEYFDAADMEISLREINALAKGSKMRIELADRDSLVFSLNGARSAIDRLIGCAHIDIRRLREAEAKANADYIKRQAETRGQALQ